MDRHAHGDSLCNPVMTHCVTHDLPGFTAPEHMATTSCKASGISGLGIMAAVLVDPDFLKFADRGMAGTCTCVALCSESIITDGNRLGNKAQPILCRDIEPACA